MSRPLRLEFAGAHYHAFSRGNARRTVFHQPTDYEVFLDLLGQTCMRYDWHCHAHCLMPNHYHLLIETHSPTLSVGMRHLNGVFTQRHNRRHKRVGHLFQGRYKALLVQDERYLLELARYIVLNPVRARLVPTATAYRWSSHAWLMAQRQAPPWASPQRLWNRLATNPALALPRLATYLGEAHDAPAVGWSRDGVLGDDAFKRDQRTRVAPSREVHAVPRAMRFVDRPTLKALFAPDPIALSKVDRNTRLWQAVDRWGYAQVAVAEFVDLDPSTVSRLVARERMSRNKT